MKNNLLRKTLFLKCLNLNKLSRKGSKCTYVCRHCFDEIGIFSDNGEISHSLVTLCSCEQVSVIKFRGIGPEKDVFVTQKVVSK
jgi:hypothetical protein